MLDVKQTSKVLLVFSRNDVILHVKRADMVCIEDSCFLWK